MVRVLDAPFSRRKVFEKTQNSKHPKVVLGNRDCGSERESGRTYVCGMSGVKKKHEEERERGYFCTSDRFSADGARTRATRVIRWRVHGVRVVKVEPKEGEQDVQVIPGRMGTRCVCRCALCVRREGTRGTFHTPQQLKPRNEVNSGKKGVRVFARDTGALC